MVERTPRALERAGELVADALLAAARREPRPRLAIPGGSAVAALATVRARLGAAWSALRLTWVDERCVPFDDAESNRGGAYRAGLLARDDAPALELALFLDGESQEQALARVGAAWEQRFDGGLDVVMLGMGADGHIASLFPGRAAPSGPVALVRDSPKPPARRVTLTRAALCTARATILVATGEAKRPALQRLAAGDESLPAHGLPGLVVVTDLLGLD